MALSRATYENRFTRVLIQRVSIVSKAKQIIDEAINPAEDGSPEFFLRKDKNGNIVPFI